MRTRSNGMRLQNWLRPLVLFICFVCLTFVFLLGAQSGSTGAIKGFVKNAETGDAVADAKVILVDTNNESLKYELKTDKKGNYYKGGLRPGYYNCTVEKDDFLPSGKTVRVRLGDTVQFDFELQSLESQVPEVVKKVDRAMRFFREEKWENAVEEFSNSIAEDQSNPMLFYYRGVAQEKAGNIEGAMMDYQKTIELKPDFVLPYSRAGKLFARKKNYEKARELYQKSVEMGDQDITTLYNYGVVLINLGKNPEAKVVLENLLTLDEEYADAYYHLGIIHIGSGDSSKAKELLERFLVLGPESQYAPIATEILKNLKNPHAK
jgi:tetratricopeptide (TPR) repeat protein